MSQAHSLTTSRLVLSTMSSLVQDRFGCFFGFAIRKFCLIEEWNAWYRWGLVDSRELNLLFLLKIFVFQASWKKMREKKFVCLLNVGKIGESKSVYIYKGKDKMKGKWNGEEWRRGIFMFMGEQVRERGATL